MKNIKEHLTKLLYPPVWAVIVLIIVSAAGLVLVFASGSDDHPAGYVLYAVSAYTLTVVCVRCVKAVSKVKRRIRDIPLAERFLTDIEFKARISLYPSLAVNALYAATNLYSGMLYRSYWFFTLAVYYVILSALRFILLRYMRKNSLGENRLSELKQSVLCAAVLMLLTFVLSGVIVLYIRDNEHFEYAGSLIYVMAAYAFYMTVSAAANLLKYRRYNSPVLLSSKTVSLAAALVSMLSLEMAMLEQFGGEDQPEYFSRIMIGVTGAVIFLIFLSLSAFTVASAKKEIKEINNSLT